MCSIRPCLLVPSPWMVMNCAMLKIYHQRIRGFRWSAGFDRRKNNDTEGEDSLQMRGCTLMKTIAVAPQFINKDWILNIIPLLYSCGALSYGRLNSKEQTIMSFAVRWMPYVLTYWQILTSRTHLMPLHSILTGESGRIQLMLRVISFLS